MIKCGVNDMKIILCNQNIISKTILPEKIEGSFWLIDELKNQNIVNIEAEDTNWVVYSNDDAKIKQEVADDNLSRTVLDKVIVESGKKYYIEYQNMNLEMYFENSFDNSITYYSLNDNTSLSFGTDIIIGENIAKDYFTIYYIDGFWRLFLKDNARVYLNGFLVTDKEKSVEYGDTIFVHGLRIAFYKGLLSINNIRHDLQLNTIKLARVDLNKNIVSESNIIDSSSIKEEDYYKEEDYFFKKARIRRFIETYNLRVTPPPKKSEKEELPLILVFGPMLTMAVVSFVSLFNAISRILLGESTWQKSITTLISSVAMILSSLFWPLLTKSINKRMEKQKEKIRQGKYNKYINKKRDEIIKETSIQSEILKENLVPLSECQKIILNKNINLWERRNDHKDFLSVRIGTGTCPADIEVDYTEEDFTMDEEDNLKIELEEMINEAKILKNVPMPYSFNNKRVTALMGEVDNLLFPFVDSILLQLLTFQSYDDLKLIFIVNKKNINVWEKYKELFHVFSNDKNVRFFATDIEEAKSVSDYLMRELSSRLQNFNEEIEENEVAEKTFSPHYLIITDDYPMYRKLDIMNAVLSIKENVGFSLICVEKQMRRLPSECIYFVHVAQNESTYYCTDIDNFSLQKFQYDKYDNINFVECLKTLSNIPIEFHEDKRSLPTALGFLEMFRVGKVEQLNTLNRWRLNDPITSLRAQIGINDEGNPIYLDLHEKYHGPHGLIAGTTGSGKSEFIITYILSLALNYSPNEVAFILIDYKGGGLAGAFENKTQGIRLPHLSGTITNLDKSELNRTLISIDSELKRRQSKFNEVRDKLGESTIDIYKYQKFFREKKIDEPMPHLFIISDEFAELKAQQPDFMDDLISAARIGRSLGIHLILATQKPSGVVNDQIWSNSKFRVCLKVQDKSDSNEMLKMPDAADITNAGRFFLQVGNNEILVLGQSGWAGTNYVPSDTAKKKYDRSISFINDTGGVIKNIEETKQNTKNDDKGDELSNVLKYICTLAEREHLKANNLWVEKIPEEIFVDSLIKKYSYNKQNDVTAIIGEYDAPSKQIQNILTLNLTSEGNTIFYGVSGSNKEMAISSLIYSLCIQYTAEDVNIYMLDFGSESMGIFSKFPQVGDIVLANESDKLLKLLGIISDDIVERKKMFADYNGEYKSYLKLSGKKLPLKVIIINNYDSFRESHANLEELLVKLTREGNRYGITFVFTATNGSSIYSKVQRNFPNKFVLDMNDRGDYIDLIGKIGNIYPAEFDGRGLFKMDEVYEFQTSQICILDKLIEYITEKAEQAKKMSTSIAPLIPSLPEEVLIDQHLLPALSDIKALPIGINRKNLKICHYNFFYDKANIISAKEIKSCIKLLETIIFEVRKLNHMTVLIDTEQELSSIGGTVNTYVDKNFEDFILKFEDFLDKKIDGKNIKVLCIISGLERLQGSLNEAKAKGFFNGIKTLDNIHLIFVDYSFKLKKMEYEKWYTSLINNSNGIWVGPGFLEQTVISNSDYSGKFKENINKQFAWVSKNGTAELIKICGSVEDDYEE